MIFFNIYHSPFPSTHTPSSQRSALRAKDDEVIAQRNEMERMKKDFARELEAKERKPNFPFFYPLFHISIAKDFADQTMRNHIRAAMSVWFLMSLGFLWGFISIMIPYFDNLLGYGGYDDKNAAFFLSLIWSLSGIPLSFYFWFYKLYELHRKTGDKSPGVSYWFWFFHGFINVSWCFLYCIGPPAIPGMAGFVVAAKFLDPDVSDDTPVSKLKLYGTFIIISATIWAVVGIFSTLMLLSIVRWYRAQGGRQITSRDIQRGVVSSVVEESAPILSS